MDLEEDTATITTVTEAKVPFRIEYLEVTVCTTVQKSRILMSEQPLFMFWATYFRVLVF